MISISMFIHFAVAVVLGIFGVVAGFIAIRRFRKYKTFSAPLFWSLCLLDFATDVGFCMVAYQMIKFIIELF